MQSSQQVVRWWQICGSLFCVNGFVYSISCSLPKNTQILGYKAKMTPRNCHISSYNTQDGNQQCSYLGRQAFPRLGMRRQKWAFCRHCGVSRRACCHFLANTWNTLSMTVETWSVKINCKCVGYFQQYQGFITCSKSKSPIVVEIGGRGDSL